eukprot:COSAG01_NODE_17497_length_1145_cov_0.966571_1_plen_319_part_10
MPAPMIASVVVTCAAQSTVFTPDTSTSWRIYEEGFGLPLYLPDSGEEDALVLRGGCDPLYVSIEPTAQAHEQGWAFQIPGESATHARVGRGIGVGGRASAHRLSTFDFAVSAPAADVETGAKTLTIQRYQRWARRRVDLVGARDLHRYRQASPNRAEEVQSAPLTVVVLRLRRHITAYDMRASSGVRPGRSMRREATWSMAGRSRVGTGVVTSTSLSGSASSHCNHAVGTRQKLDCAQPMLRTQTPHPTTGTFRTNDDLHRAEAKSAVGAAPRSRHGGVLPPSGGAGGGRSHKPRPLAERPAARKCVFRPPPPPPPPPL